MGYFLPFYPLNSTKNENFDKNEKHLQISSFCICVPKIMIRWCMVSEVWCAMCRQTCGQMDRWMQKVAYRGGCPHLKNIYVLWEHVTSLSKWILKRSHQISGWHLAINAKHKILKTTFFYQHLIYYLPQQLTLFKEREFQ